MSLGKQIKLNLIDKLNKVVLPKMEFKSKIGNKYLQKFSGIVKMDKLKLYCPHTYDSSSTFNRFVLVVDVTVSGTILLRKCYRDENEVINMLKNSEGMHFSPYSTTSRLDYTKNYNSVDKKRKMEMTTKVKNSIVDQIVENVGVMCLRSYLSKMGHLHEIKIGKIKYE